MAKACILLKKTVGTDNDAAVINALKNSGYSFDKFHILSQLEREKITDLFEKLTQSGYSVLFLTEESLNEWLKPPISFENERDKQGLMNTFGDTVYALNEKNIEEALVQRLKERKWKISVAESFTGGGIAKRITSVSGASEVYFEGVNAYNEASKIKRLGVSKATLDEKGAVSKETAFEMARGLLSTGDCNVAVATTGLAGPNSDGSGKPVGLCYISVGTNEKIEVFRYVFEGSRKKITETAIEYALFHVFGTLNDV